MKRYRSGGLENPSRLGGKERRWVRSRKLSRVPECLRLTNAAAQFFHILASRSTVFDRILPISSHNALRLFFNGTLMTSSSSCSASPDYGSSSDDGYGHRRNHGHHGRNRHSHLANNYTNNFRRIEDLRNAWLAAAPALERQAAREAAAESDAAALPRPPGISPEYRAATYSPRPASPPRAPEATNRPDWSTVQAQIVAAINQVPYQPQSQLPDIVVQAPAATTTGCATAVCCVVSAAVTVVVVAGVTSYARSYS